MVSRVGSPPGDAAARLLAIASEAICSCSGEALCRLAAADLAPGPYRLLAVGKAALAMARGVVAVLGPPTTGLIVTKAQANTAEWATGPVSVRVAGHPVPDERSARAGAAVLAELGRATADERVLVLLSGGASALLSAPQEGLTLEDLAATTAALLAGGLGIDEMNLVRRHLTVASGGRLARACAATAEVLVLSDVLGDDLRAIGSGPFAPDPSTFAEALAIAEATPRIPAAALRLLRQGARGDRPDSVKPGEPCFERVRHRLVGSHDSLRRAALASATGLGYRARLLPATGAEVEVVARELLAVAAGLEPGELLIGGGEPTVVLPSKPGRGGRNQALALRLAQGLAGGPARTFAAIASDGGDGPTDAAGAIVDERSWEIMQTAGDPAAALERADAYPLLDAVDQLVHTGATGTNVLDLHLLAATAHR